MVSAAKLPVEKVKRCEKWPYRRPNVGAVSCAPSSQFRTESLTLRADAACRYVTRSCIGNSKQYAPNSYMVAPHLLLVSPKPVSSYSEECPWLDRPALVKITIYAEWAWRRGRCRMNSLYAVLYAVSLDRHIFLNLWSFYCRGIFKNERKGIFACK